MVEGNALRFLMICRCSSCGSCMREDIFALACLWIGGLEVERMAFYCWLVLRWRVGVKDVYCYAQYL